MQMVEDAAPLFDRVLVVSFNAASPKPEVTYTFPPPTTQGKDAKDTLAESVSAFCYPEAHAELLSKVNSSHYASETFSFVLTDSLGGKTYGYCRRFKADNKELECFCILSHIPSFSLFSQILDIVETRRKVSTSLVYSFLKTVLAQVFPAPGETLSIKTFSASKNGEMDVYNLTRPADEYLTAYVSFYNLFHTLDLEDILKVWEYLLCERRVVFCSKNLGTLSSCINALCALLYPFSWQHIFIPILPQTLIHFITAPMPFLCGILSSSKSSLNGFPLDEVIMLDLDDKEFTLDYPFERVLPIPQFCTLKNNLRKLLRSGKKDKDFDHEVAKYFLIFFYTIFRDYKKFITPAKPLPPVPVQEVKEAPSGKKKAIKRRNPKGEFDRAAFLKSFNDESTQKFLELFGSSQMFETFILEREEMAVVGSATLPDCHFLTLCNDTLPDNQYVGTAECERCGKGIPLKFCCTYENYHFHPNCFECKKCEKTLAYDDFGAVVVQVNAAAADPANKVRTVCASCESNGSSGGSGGGVGGSAASFLKRMKHAVVKKIDLLDPGTRPSTGKKVEDERTPEKMKSPSTPPSAHTAQPISSSHQPLPKPPPQQPAPTPAAEKPLPDPPSSLPVDKENEKRTSVAIDGHSFQTKMNQIAAGNIRNSLNPVKESDQGYFKSKFKSVQLQREPAIPNIKLAYFFEAKCAPAPAPPVRKNITKRKSKSDIFPINEKVKVEAAKVSLDDNSLDMMQEESNNSQSETLQDTTKPPTSPKPLPRAPRGKLVPPNPAIVNFDTNHNGNKSVGDHSDHRPPTAHSTSTPQTSIVSTKPRSGSGSSGSGSGSTTPRSVNFAEGSVPATKPRSGSGSGSFLGKPRSGSVGRPSVAPSVGPTTTNNSSSSNSTTAPASATSSGFVHKSSASTRPRSGSVGRPVNNPEPTLMSQHRSNTTTTSGPSGSSFLPASYNKPAQTAKPVTKTKQLPTPPSTPITNPRADAFSSSSSTPSTSSSTSQHSTHSNIASAINNLNKPSTPPSTSAPINVMNKPKSQPTPATPRSTPTFTASVPKTGTYQVPILTKSKSMPDSRKSTIVLDAPPAQTCAVCKKSFGSPSDPPDTPYRIVSTNDAYYHPACFVCAHCGKVIETAYVTRDHHAYHRDCAATIAHTCNVCNKPILSQYLEFRGRVIHKECFVCVSCKEPLAKMGSKYVELDGNSYCLECTKRPK